MSKTNLLRAVHVMALQNGSHRVAVRKGGRGEVGHSEGDVVGVAGAEGVLAVVGKLVQPVRGGGGRRGHLGTRMIKIEINLATSVGNSVLLTMSFEHVL